MGLELFGTLAAGGGGGQISLLWSLPFAVLLAAIALGPLIHRHWWEKWYPAVAIALGAVAAVYYLGFADSAAKWWEEMEAYVSFIILLGALYVVSGGIVIHVNRLATPTANSVMLLLGAVLANFFGTTGASMLLIRPYLRMNRGHLKAYHVVFFIFLVSNIGGLLTPIGDPPLFLGYLSGVPFWWVLENCRWIWAFTVSVLLVIFFILDKIDHGRSERMKPDDPGPAVFIHGIHNLLFIGLIVFAVFQRSVFSAAHEISEEGLTASRALHLLMSREMLMVAAALGAKLLTSRVIFQKNEFTYAPIREVAILFLGIFSAMVPALQWLNANAERLPLNTPGQFYFVSGALSSTLDNAPTYLTLLEAELGHLAKDRVDQAVAAVKRMRESNSMDIDPLLDPQVRSALAALKGYHEQEIRTNGLSRAQVEVGFLLGDPALNLYIIAISAGSVLFGACTYIGNGPNFMVKSIADAWGAPTVGFLGYIFKYSLPILIPVYVLVWAIFLRT